MKVAAFILGFACLAIICVHGKPNPDLDSDLDDFVHGVKKSVNRGIDVLKGDRKLNIEFGPDGIDVKTGPTQEEIIIYCVIGGGILALIGCLCCCCCGRRR